MDNDIILEVPTGTLQQFWSVQYTLQQYRPVQDTVFVGKRVSQGISWFQSATSLPDTTTFYTLDFNADSNKQTQFPSVLVLNSIACNPNISDSYPHCTTVPTANLPGSEYKVKRQRSQTKPKRAKKSTRVQRCLSFPLTRLVSFINIQRRETRGGLWSWPHFLLFSSDAPNSPSV